MQHVALLESLIKSCSAEFDVRVEPTKVDDIPRIKEVVRTQFYKPTQQDIQMFGMSPDPDQQYKRYVCSTEYADVNSYSARWCNDGFRERFDYFPLGKTGRNTPRNILMFDGQVVRELYNDLKPKRALIESAGQAHLNNQPRPDPFRLVLNRLSRPFSQVMHEAPDLVVKSLSDEGDAAFEVSFSDPFSTWGQPPDNQRWSWDGDGPQRRLKSKSSGFVLDVDRDGKIVQRKGDAKARSQLWQFIAIGELVKLVHVGTGKLLGITGDSDEDNAEAVLVDDESNQARRWKIVNDGEFFKLVNGKSGNVLDAKEASRDQGSQIVQYADKDVPTDRYVLRLDKQFRILQHDFYRKLSGQDKKQRLWERRLFSGWEDHQLDDGEVISFPSKCRVIYTVGTTATGELAVWSEELISYRSVEFNPQIAKSRFTLEFPADATVEDRTFELRVGQAAPEISGEDIRGRPLKLSDYRGDVVVLSFWGSWCGPCMKMVPEERKLYERMRNKPFVLLGVDCGDARKKAARTIESEQMDWPSVWDGGGDVGPIQGKYNISEFPSVYVLDKQGVTRFINVRGKELDQAVDQLVAETAPAGPETQGNVKSDNDAKSEQPPPAAGDRNSKTTAGPKPSAPKEQGSAMLRELERKAAPLLAAMTKEGAYKLGEKQNLRRVAPPFPAIRMEWYRVANPTQAEAIPAGPAAIVFRWSPDKLTILGMTFSSAKPPADAYSLSNLLDALAEIHKPMIEGDLLETPIPGDWVVRSGTKRDVIVRELNVILRNELSLQVHLEFRTVERPVYVVDGIYQHKPVPGGRDKDTTILSDRTVTSDAIEVFGRELVPGGKAGGGLGKFREFLDGLGDWIGRPIVSEVKEPPKGELSWFLHAHSPYKEEIKAEDHDPALVLANIKAQTGLSFRKETRRVIILFVSRE